MRIYKLGGRDSTVHVLKYARLHLTCVLLHSFLHARRLFHQVFGRRPQVPGFQALAALNVGFRSLGFRV